MFDEGRNGGGWLHNIFHPYLRNKLEKQQRISPNRVLMRENDGGGGMVCVCVDEGWVVGGTDVCKSTPQMRQIISRGIRNNAWNETNVRGREKDRESESEKG